VSAPETPQQQRAALIQQDAGKRLHPKRSRHAVTAPGVTPWHYAAATIERARSSMGPFRLYGSKGRAS
jgi:hypothetical protein